MLEPEEPPDEPPPPPQDASAAAATTIKHRCRNPLMVQRLRRLLGRCHRSQLQRSTPQVKNRQANLGVKLCSEQIEALLEITARRQQHAAGR